jgi:hypothetical protein
MYHGTILESTALIEQKGFRASDGGLLGPGVYMSRNMQKAQQYRGSGGVILEVLVRVGRVCHINPCSQGESLRLFHAAVLSVQCSMRVLIAKGLLTKRRSKWIVEASVKLLSVAPNSGRRMRVNSKYEE